MGSERQRALIASVMTKRVPEAQTTRARELRRDATEAERRLWRLISRYRPKFTRQLPIGPYFADFACREARLVVEVDGGQHSESVRDERRDAFMREQGWRVLRLWNSDVLGNPEGSVETIMAAATPSPSLPGRGERERHPSLPGRGERERHPSVPGRGD